MKKEDLKLEKLVEEMKGKSKEEMAEIMIREGILDLTQKVKSKFNIIQIRKSLWERFIERLKFWENKNDI